MAFLWLSSTHDSEGLALWNESKEQVHLTPEIRTPEVPLHVYDSLPLESVDASANEIWSLATLTSSSMITRAWLVSYRWACEPLAYQILKGRSVMMHTIHITNARFEINVQFITFLVAI
jgi:hypothetical protein